MFIKFKTENLIAKLQNLNRNFTFSWVSLIGFSTTWPEGATLLGWPKSIYYDTYIRVSCSTCRRTVPITAHRMHARSFDMPARNSPQIRWAFRRYCNISVLNRLIVFVHSPMSINFSAFRNIWEYLIFRRRFLGRNGLFPNISYLCITCCD